jgi:penicillin-binding protein 2
VEGVVQPPREVFSPGYLDVPNPYDAENPTRFVDWRYQGNVNLYSAIAQSSNVYFYIVGGGSPQRDPQLGPEWDTNFGVKGLGISKLHAWWEKFRLGEPTGIDLPGEAKGFLPTPEWKEKRTGRSWLLGDSYNVSIGQGDLSVTPIALVNYVATIANNGVMHQPAVNKAKAPGNVIADLSAYAAEIKEVQNAMRFAVTSPEGTARLLNTLPLPTAGKTGSAQVFNNTQENAFFVGYGPVGDPQIAILILVENSKEGSLNAVPIANEVLYWYYMNRVLRATQ